MDLMITAKPVETREFDHGRFELFRIAGREVGRATYAPGWRWTTHVAPIAGTALCEVEHVGYVVRGAAAVRMPDDTEIVLRAGDFFAIPPGHDSWVIGDEEYVSLHLLGAHAYAREQRDPRADAVRAGYAGVARAYRERLLDELAGKPLDRAFLDAFAERCRGTRVVEVGCGPGQVARYLADRGCDVEGLDLSPAMIDEARASHPGIAFRVGDMFALPYDAASLGGIVAFYAIVHLSTDELAALFREIHRVLAAGGLAAIAFHVGNETVHVGELFGRATSLDFMFHEPDAVCAVLVDAGFAIEARLDRAPYRGAEHPSRRCYLLARA